MRTPLKNTVRSMKHTTADTPRPVVELVVAEQPDIRHEDSGVDIDSMQCIEVVATVCLRKIAIGVIKVPLSARRAGVIARCGLRIQTELRHEPGTHIFIVEISLDTELRYLNFIGPGNLARPANRVVFGMVEIADIVNVHPSFRVKNFVSIGDSLVRALPVTQVKPANAKGSVASGFACSICSFQWFARRQKRRHCSTGMTFGLASAAEEDGETTAGLAVTVAVVELNESGCEDGAAPGATAGEFLLVSSSATRFSSSSTRSSSHPSRSVDGAGASILGATLSDGAVFAGGLLVSLSSASKRFGTMLAHSSAARSS